MRNLILVDKLMSKKAFALPGSVLYVEENGEVRIMFARQEVLRIRIKGISAAWDRIASPSE